MRPPKASELESASLGVALRGYREDDVEVDGGVDGGDAGVGGEEIFFEGEDGGESFDGSAGSDGVAVEGFGGADGNL